MDRIQEGMVVHSSDGERLGKVVAVRGNTIVIEKGIFFPKDYTCRLDDIETVRGDEVRLRLSKVELESGFSQPDQAANRKQTGATASGARQQVSVPISEEQLEVQKRQRKSGEVRVSKHVVQENKQVTVPVTREEVRVERVPAGREAREGEAHFAEESISVPVMEEEVVTKKRPVVREEVRIQKESRTEQRPVSAQVRREEADIEDDREGGNRDRSTPIDPDASYP